MPKIDPTRLVDLAYSAALEPDAWHDWASTAISCLAGSAGTLSVVDTLDNSILKLDSIGWSDAEQEYNRLWFKHDPLVPAILRDGTARVFLDTDHVDLNKKNTAEYMNWQRSAGMDHHMAASVPLGDGLRIGLSIHRSLEDGFTPAEEYEAFRRVIPEVSRAMQLSFIFSKLLADSYWEGILTGIKDRTAMLIDERGRVVRYNESASRLLSQPDGLDITRSHLHASLPSDDRNLQGILGRAIQTANPRSGAGKVRRPSGKAALIVVCYPLHYQRRQLVPAEAAALVIVYDPSNRRPAATVLYQEAFGLTPREAEIAAALVAGHSVESAAAALGIGLPTARTHVRRIFEKTGIARQNELMHLLSTAF